MRPLSHKSGLTREPHEQNAHRAIVVLHLKTTHSFCYVLLKTLSKDEIMILAKDNVPPASTPKPKDRKRPKDIDF